MSGALQAVYRNLRSFGAAPISAGALFAWGADANFGVLGLGNLTTYSSPKQVGALTNWKVLAFGAHTLAVKSDGTLWAWGYNAQYGALGLGNRTNYSSPKQVGALTNWLTVAAGYNNSFGIKTNGTLWSWGFNNHGQLGLGTVGDYAKYSSPKQVGSLTNWVSIAAGGGDFAVAVKSDGTLWGWGINNRGQLGLDNITKYSSPMQVGSLTNWSFITASGDTNFCLAIKKDGTLWSWGFNEYGNLGLNNRTYYSSPMQVGALTNWSKASANTHFSLATKSTGTLWSWGRNASGNLGQGNTTYLSSPKQVGSLTTWLSVGSTRNAGFAISTTNALWVLGGLNSSGQLGLNTTTLYYSSPKQIGALTGWQTVGGINTWVLATKA